MQTVTLVTHGVKVTVQAEFQYDHSNPDQRYFLFSYRVIIENNSEYVVKLLRRHWFIFDSCSEYREVEGEGVVGQQPVLTPGEVYEYESACNLNTDIGKMNGTYLMMREMDGAQFYVNIPEFELMMPARLN